jgi:putative addiction module killer protein
MTIEARIWITRTTSKPSSEAILRLVQPRPCMRPTKSASAGAWGSDGSGIVAHRWSGHALNELPLNWAVQLGQGLVGQPAADCAGTAHGRVPSQFVREVRISRCELQFTNCELRLTLRLCWKSSNCATYEAWFADLADRKVKARILARIDRLALGNPGDVKPVGSGVSELRVDYGPGYRVYYVQRGQVVAVLLCGGDKSTQARDIKRAIEISKELKG